MLIKSNYSSGNQSFELTFDQYIYSNNPSVCLSVQMYSGSVFRPGSFRLSSVTVDLIGDSVLFLDTFSYCDLWLALISAALAVAFRTDTLWILAENDKIA